MARGGKRTPARPAPVSGPGALSARTDGGPGNQRQPLSVASGGPYGARQEMEQLQGAAPMASAVDAAQAPAAPPPMPFETGNPFRATERPGESALAGIRPQGPTPAPDFVSEPTDPNELLLLLYKMYPHPDIARLIGG